LTENVAHQFTTAVADGFVHKHPNLTQELIGPDVVDHPRSPISDLSSAQHS